MEFEQSVYFTIKLMPMYYMYEMYLKVTLKLPFVILIYPSVEYSILGIDEPQYFVPLICLH